MEEIVRVLQENSNLKKELSDALVELGRLRQFKENILNQSNGGSK